MHFLPRLEELLSFLRVGGWGRLLRNSGCCVRRDQGENQTADEKHRQMVSNEFRCSSEGIKDSSGIILERVRGGA